MIDRHHANFGVGCTGGNDTFVVVQVADGSKCSAVDNGCTACWILPTISDFCDDIDDETSVASYT